MVQSVEGSRNTLCKSSQALEIRKQNEHVKLSNSMDKGARGREMEGNESGKKFSFE